MFRASAPRGPATEEAIQDPGRIISLSDGIFAFAMTLLALSLAIPVGPPGSNTEAYSSTLAHKLLTEYPDLYAYILAFIIIAMWWTLHHALFAYIKRFDATLMWLNLLFLLGIAVSPFTLGVWIAYDNTTAGTELYGSAQALVGVAMCAMVYYATDHRRLVDPRMNDVEVQDVRLRATFLTAAFAATVPVAVVDDGKLVPYTQAIWGAILVLQRFVRRKNLARLSVLSREAGKPPATDTPPRSR
jgi:uncharacterized membrane protein